VQAGKTVDIDAGELPDQSLQSLFFLPVKMVVPYIGRIRWDQIRRWWSRTIGNDARESSRSA